MGTVGLLLLTKDLGLIKEVRSPLNELQKKKFRISERIITEALKKAGEIN
jgi:predicted nucleic acid-binding protein